MDPSLWEEGFEYDGRTVVKIPPMKPFPAHPCYAAQILDGTPVAEMREILVRILNFCGPISVKQFGRAAVVDHFEYGAQDNSLCAKVYNHSDPGVDVHRLDLPPGAAEGELTYIGFNSWLAKHLHYATHQDYPLPVVPVIPEEKSSQIESQHKRLREPQIGQDHQVEIPPWCPEQVMNEPDKYPCNEYVTPENVQERLERGDLVIKNLPFRNSSKPRIPAGLQEIMPLLDRIRRRWGWYISDIDEARDDLYDFFKMENSPEAKRKHRLRLKTYLEEHGFSVRQDTTHGRTFYSISAPHHQIDFIDNAAGIEYVDILETVLQPSAERWTLVTTRRFFNMFIGSRDRFKFLVEVHIFEADPNIAGFLQERMESTSPMEHGARYRNQLMPVKIHKGAFLEKSRADLPLGPQSPLMVLDLSPEATCNYLRHASQAFNASKIVLITSIQEKPTLLEITRRHTFFRTVESYPVSGQEDIQLLILGRPAETPSDTEDCNSEVDGQEPPPSKKARMEAPNSPAQPASSSLSEALDMADLLFSGQQSTMEVTYAKALWCQAQGGEGLLQAHEIWSSIELDAVAEDQRARLILIRERLLLEYIVFLGCGHGWTKSHDER